MKQNTSAAESRAYYPFQLGSFHCLAISDGYHTYRLDQFFANVPAEQLAAVLPRAQTIVSSYTCLYVNVGAHHCLIDAGAGRMVSPTAGTLLQNMRSAGLDPADVDTLVLTHGHPDHIGGLLDEAGRPVFANAQAFIWKAEHAFWFDDNVFGRVPANFVELARKNLSAIHDRLTLVDSEDYIHEGIRVLPAPGHTPGHMALVIESGGKRLLHVADTVLSPLHLEHPGWLPIFDLDPEAAVESKRRIFNRAATDNSLVFAHHFPPFPALGHVAKEGDGWLWLPIIHG